MESVNMDVWKISDFTNRVLKDLSAQFPEEHISIHRNTIDTWFSELEDRGIHFVRRASGEKVYGLEDLDIAKFIFLRRRDKFSKEVIYRILPEHFELRDIPDDYYGNSSNFVDSHFKEEVFGYIQKELEKKTNEIKSIGESIHDYIQQEKDWFIKQKNMLPDPVSKEQKEKEIREQVTKDLIKSRLAIEQKVEEDAINQWEDLPESERTTKSGWFGKRSEDLGKRAEFIRKYKHEHLAAAIENALIDQQ